MTTRPSRRRPAVEPLEGRWNLAAGAASAAAGLALMSARPPAIVAAALRNTVTTLTAQPARAQTGETVNLVATVRPALGSGRRLTGFVVFSIDGVSRPAVPLQGEFSGRMTAVLPTAGLAAGTHTVGAAYLGNPVFAGSAARPVAVVIVPGLQAPTTTELAVLTVPAAAGRPVTFRATVATASPTAATSTPSGAVVFTVDGQPRDLVPLVPTPGGGATAELTYPGFPLGYHTATASYAGDPLFGPSASAVATFLVQSLDVVPTAVRLAAAPVPADADAPVTITATVEPINSASLAPTGAVVFRVDGVALPAVPITSDALGVATAVLSLPALSTGVHTVTASYPGDPRFGGSASDPLRVVVGSAVEQAVRLGLTAAPSNPVAGRPVTFTATVSPPTGSGTVPTGLVTLILDGRPVATLPLAPGGPSASARARFVRTLTAGLHRAAVVYAGDAVYPPASTLQTPLTLVATRGRR